MRGEEVHGMPIHGIGVFEEVLGTGPAKAQGARASERPWRVSSRVRLTRGRAHL